MKTLITVLGAEHSALIPFHICTKETAEKNKTKKKKRTQSSETILCRREEVYAILEGGRHSTVNLQQKSGLNLNRQLVFMVVYDPPALLF